MTKLQTLQSMLSRANWAAILLFSALLAQAPHAAWVFLRIAPHDDTAGFSVAIALAILGAVVYWGPASRTRRPRQPRRPVRPRLT